ncbi:hypothetical protein [Wolbachia endosymbiont of Rhagoletis cerasi]|nr:hypothetical protein [Wolbachia endosymbiont of Rhagoletis cerasi]
MSFQCLTLVSIQNGVIPVLDTGMTPKGLLPSWMETSVRTS